MDAISKALEVSGRLLPTIECRLNEPMKNHTSFRTGGPVRAMFLPKSAEELTELSAVLRESGVRPFIMGNGTNLLVDDRAFEIIVIKTTELNNIAQTGETEITAASGIILAKLALFACERGLAGLEFAHGIPGTLGGAVSMNAGAYGGEMKDVIQVTTALNPETGVFSVTDDEHDFSYRHSRFLDNEDIILSSAVRLRKDDAAKIRARMDELSQRRRESQPLDLPSAGSTFKRPQDGYAAALIEEARLKGFAIGGAVVSEKHSGFIVNRGDASFKDIMAVIEHVRETVFRRFGIALETEVKILR
ncbi:MAG: UDP-N-acetylmuramate dehydrogenase [Oscillospiraceae bacterium]|nr:UDP-N-acetylmuramate dehydrogenase [Oscillospiraceae bacterium]